MLQFHRIPFTIYQPKAHENDILNPDAVEIVEPSELNQEICRETKFLKMKHLSWLFIVALLAACGTTKEDKTPQRETPFSQSPKEFVSSKQQLKKEVAY